MPTSRHTGPDDGPVDHDGGGHSDHGGDHHGGHGSDHHGGHGSDHHGGLSGHSGDHHRDHGDPGVHPEPPWTRNDALVAGGACAMNLLSYVFFDDPGGRYAVTVAGFLLVAVAALPLLARRRHPVATLAAVLALDATATLTVPLPSHFGAVLLVALYSVARACSGRVTALAALAAVGTVTVTLVSRSGGRIPPWQDVLLAPLTTLLVVGTALAVNRWQQEVAANRRLLADRAVADERRRIARELHDIVAHHITTMQLMAGGARANLAHPEVARDALVTLESSGRLALSEMRQLLDVLRAGDEPEDAPSQPQPGAGDLGRLVSESRLAGLPTECAVTGTERPLPPTVGLTVFRIVQEALTNSRKYAGPAARAAVRLTYGQDRITVEVRDDGGGAPGPDDVPDRGPGGSGGYGLIGMRERVALHGGTLTAGPQSGGGFAVLAELPLAEGETAEAAVQYEGGIR
ncbi:sensor histidine kinase [Streptomyces sp. NPDC058657]|uniref:sensor histidine kinase n=1 Tax=unclassified Streptomyces TaxID=2593676 RepID=UPI003668EFEA